MSKPIDALEALRRTASSNIQIVAFVGLVSSLTLNLYASFNRHAFNLPIFDWSLLIVGACSGFLIVTYVIKAHEYSKWQRFRKNMISDLYEQVCDLLTLYEHDMAILSGQVRRSRTGHETDYFQVADAPVAVRRFQKRIEEKKADVFHRLSLSLVGITSEIANDVAEFKSIYYKLYILTKFIIEDSDHTGPQKPSKYERLKAESAFDEIYGLETYGTASDLQTQSTLIYLDGSGPFERFFEVINCLAKNIGLKAATLDAISAGTLSSELSFVPGAVSGSGRSAERYLELHRQRVLLSKRIDKEIHRLASTSLFDTDRGKDGV